MSKVKSRDISRDFFLQTVGYCLVGSKDWTSVLYSHNVQHSTAIHSPDETDDRARIPVVKISRNNRCVYATTESRWSRDERASFNGLVREGRRKNGSTIGPVA